MDNTATIKQIILITDGHSNKGEDPVSVAYQASAAGISVNTIGLLHQGQLGEQGRQEIEKIAQAGEGVWEVVEAQELVQSIQLISRQSSAQTIEKLVSKQLNKVLGLRDLVDLPPHKRGKVLQLIEELGEKSYLKCVILLDCSGSMQNKLELAKDSVVDLLLSLQARTGGGEIALVAFPGPQGQMAKVVSGFTCQVESLEKSLETLRVAGGTPTGPALKEALNLFEQPELSQASMIV